MISALGTSEIFVIMLIIVICFGSKDLPHLMRKVATLFGKVDRFKESCREEIENVMDESRLAENRLKQEAMGIKPQLEEQEVSSSEIESTNG